VRTAALHLDVAVRARQHALGSCGSSTVEASPDALVGEPERLLGRIHVMELEGCGAAVIAA
jgi:hypothetical protein